MKLSNDKRDQILSYLINYLSIISEDDEIEIKFRQHEHSDKHDIIFECTKQRKHTDNDILTELVDNKLNIRIY